MPIYALQCRTCGHEEDVYRSIAKMNEDLPACCEKTMERKIVAPMVAADIQPYQSMVTGEMITSRSQHRAHLRQHKVIEVGNENLAPKAPTKMTPPPGLKQELINQVNAKLG